MSTIHDLFAPRPSGKPRKQKEPDADPVQDAPEITPALFDDAYGLTAITEIAQEMRECASGGRDTLLNTLCMKAGRLVRDGHLLRETAERHLLEAALSIADPSFDEWKIEEKVERVITEGMHSDYEVEPQSAGDVFDAAPEVAPTEDKPTLHEQMVAREVAIQRARREAARRVAAEEQSATFREPPYQPTLTAELLEPDEQVQFHVEALLPVGGNALLTAPFKAGKTTAVNDYARAFADHDLGETFLSRYKVTPDGDGRLAICNYEVAAGMYRKWLREARIVNTDRIVLLNLRGYRLPLISPDVEKWYVEWLKRNEVVAWILDPFARASVGTDENSNTEVGIWTDTVDVIKEKAGVRDLILPNHTGREKQEAGDERGRGATRLDDWADVRWIITKDKTGNRFFRATGRDVDVEEEQLSYDEATRRLSVGGGNRRWVEGRERRQKVLDFINDNPGCSQRQLKLGVGMGLDTVKSVVTDLHMHHKIRLEDASGTVQHWANTRDAL